GDGPRIAARVKRRGGATRGEFLRSEDGHRILLVEHHAGAVRFVGNRHAFIAVAGIRHEAVASLVLFRGRAGGIADEVLHRGGEIGAVQGVAALGAVGDPKPATLVGTAWRDDGSQHRVGVAVVLVDGKDSLGRAVLDGAANVIRAGSYR